MSDVSALSRREVDGDMVAVSGNAVTYHFPMRHDLTFDMAKEGNKAARAAGGIHHG